MVLWIEAQLQLHFSVVIHRLLKGSCTSLRDGGLVNESARMEFPAPDVRRLLLLEIPWMWVLSNL